MPFSTQQFVAARPYLYHLTHRQNRGRIQRTMQLQTARSLLENAGRKSLTRQRRPEHLTIRVDGGEVVVRDQRPLHAGPMHLEGGWTFEDFVEHLNGLVFWWPGSVTGPRDYGRRHFRRYEAERPVLLRLRTENLLAANLDRPPLFCRFNSGAPRCSRGRHAPRGADTFLPADRFAGGVGNVVEVVFRGDVALPTPVEFGTLDAQGLWQAEP